MFAFKRASSQNIPLSGSPIGVEHASRLLLDVWVRVVVHSLDGLHDPLLEVSGGSVPEGVQCLVPHEPLPVLEALKDPVPELGDVLSDVTRAQVLEGSPALDWVRVVGSPDVVLDRFVAHCFAGVFLLLVA